MDFHKLSIQHPIIFYDGVCHLCNHSIQWVLKRDRKEKFRFCALQHAKSELGPKGNLINGSLESVILLNQGKKYHYADAVLKILSLLPFPYYLGSIFSIIPRPFRNLIYQWVARRRYGWFGKAEKCIMPSENQQNRFLLSDISS